MSIFFENNKKKTACGKILFSLVNFNSPTSNMRNHKITLGVFFVLVGTPHTLRGSPPQWRRRRRAQCQNDDTHVAKLMR